MINETMFTEQTINNLQKFKISMREAEEAFKSFYEAIKQTNQKRFLRHARIEHHTSDVLTEIGEALFDEGLICNGCDLVGTHCEGSNCGYQMEGFFSTQTKSELGKLYFKIYGDRWNNLSLRIKNELRKNK